MVRIVQIEWVGDQAVKVAIEEPNRAIRNRMVGLTDEVVLELVRADRSWSFEGDGHLFQLMSGAQSIDLAYLFDPYLALSTSIDRLPAFDVPRDDFQIRWRACSKI